MHQNMLLKTFFKYTLLNILGMIGLSCYILADTFFISKGIGADGLTALNMSIPVYNFMNGIALMLGMGAATHYAILTGKNEKAQAVRFIQTACIMALFFSAFFMILGLFFAGPMARLFGAKGIVCDMTETYLRVILLFTPLFMLNNIFQCYVRNDGNPRLSMTAMLTGCLGNIVLDYIFVFPLQLGIFGAVLATGFAPLISLSILSTHLIRKKNELLMKPVAALSQKANIRCAAAANIFSLGFPSFITELSSGIVILVFNTIILRLEGNIGVAAYGVVANLSLVILSIYTGIAQGIQPLISNNSGSGNIQNIRKIMKYACISLIFLSAAIYGCIYIFAENIASVFNSEQNAVMQSIAATGLRYYFTACLFAGFNIIMSVYFTSIGHPKPSHVISLLRGLFVIVPVTFILSALFEMTGIWLAFPVTELLIAVLAALLYMKNR